MIEAADAEDVVAGDEFRGDIDAHGLVPRDDGADGFGVEEDRALVVHGRAERGLLHLALDLENLAEKAALIGAGGFAVVVMPDPLGSLGKGLRGQRGEREEAEEELSVHKE